MEGGILLHCDTSNRVMRTRTVLDIITDIFTKNKDAYQEEAKKQLVGSYVVTRYNNRTYKVDDIDFEMNPKSEFIDHLNNSVSFEDYYRNAYKIDLKDLGQPMVSKFRLKIPLGIGQALIFLPLLPYPLVGASQEDARAGRRPHQDHTRARALLCRRSHRRAEGRLPRDEGRG